MSVAFVLCVLLCKFLKHILITLIAKYIVLNSNSCVKMFNQNIHSTKSHTANKQHFAKWEKFEWVLNHKEYETKSLLLCQSYN